MTSLGDFRVAMSKTKSSELLVSFTRHQRNSEQKKEYKMHRAKAKVIVLKYEAQLTVALTVFKEAC